MPRFLRLFLLSCLCLGGLPFGRAEVLPQLMLEASMHSARIVDAAADAEGRWLVTAGEDKSARVWNLEDSRLLSVLRVPAREGTEGALRAVAISPDGERIALAGLTGRSFSAAKHYSIYIFERSTARLQQVLPGLEQGVETLAWSPDGRYLAAGLNAKGGVLLFDMRSGAWFAADADYRGTVTGLDFSPDSSQLASASLDGRVRRYRLTDSGLQRDSLRQIPGGARPGHLRFSPDGRHVAVGFMDTAMVYVLQAADLLTAWVPNSEGAERRSKQDPSNLQNVTWSADGGRLCAGGRWMRSGRSMLRCWEHGGRGGFADIPASANTVVALQALPDGRLAVAGMDQTWLLLSAEGKTLGERRSPLTDFRAGGLQVSPDGRQVAIALKAGAAPTAFDLVAGRLDQLPADLQKVRSSVAGLRGEWRGENRPVFNGQPLALFDQEEARAAAVSEDGQRVVIGTDTRLYSFDAEGKRLWSNTVPGPIRQVAWSGDGQWVVSANGDGTLHWLRARDGREVLRLFPHSDGSRWVMWTPAGYYKASEGGENLFGWLLTTQGDVAPDFFPASRFRDKFRRADQVERALNPTPPVAPAATSIEQIAPPVVAILEPGRQVETSLPVVHLRLAIRSLGDAPPTGLRVRVAGQAVEVALPRFDTLSGRTPELIHEIDVPVPRHDSEILVFAENRNGVSTPAPVQVRWQEPSWAQQTVRPKLYVLAVGISAYPQAALKLDFAAKDARDFVTALKRGSGVLYRDVEVRAISDEKATRDEILDGLEWLRRQVTHRDVGVMFLAGHGVTDNDGTYYFLPWGGDPERLKRSAVIYHEIRNTLAALPGKALFFIDTCHAGSVLGSARRAGVGDMAAMINELASAENGVIVFSASTGRQYSLENRDWGNGAFTKALVEGLNGAADFQKTGRITHKMLDFYVSERVKALTGGKQTPVTIIPQGVPDFPVAVLPPATP
ncbi:caspase family protein [Uliginosibacterium sp. 31-16]|uniref:caspase family protein n=1 Tax=Uliginosibacterium sp. 31-16 TaxID=3068315 RepID=UPI00273D941F|nr:caspase family protein [Uliginosibacterium sp. 31-16]MDP5238424.1 caspase family protein [Uliginosibacterium sp. 31-16]